MQGIINNKFFQSNMDVEIITIGNELLSGRTLNTNSSYIGKIFTEMGFVVRRICTVGDNEEDIVNAIRESLSRKPGILIITGGLGPTYDDITSKSLSVALNKKYVLNNDAYEMLKERYRKFNLDITPERIKMAYMPENAIPIPNPEGTAPGIYIPGETEILCTPGVPREMSAILDIFIKNFMKKKSEKEYHEKNIRVTGIIESTIAPHVKKIVDKYNVYIKTHPVSFDLKKPVLEIQIVSDSMEKLNESSYELKKVIKDLHGKIEE